MSRSEHPYPPGIGSVDTNLGRQNPLNEKSEITEPENPFRKKIEKRLAFIYGEEVAPQLSEQLHTLGSRERQKIPEKYKTVGSLFSERDSVLITFPNSFQKQGEPHLRTLAHFLNENIGDALNSVHILPFNPSGGDRGFSPIDRSKVDAAFGEWEDISAIADTYHVMADIVVGHMDKESDAFQRFLAGDPAYQNYFIWWRPEELDQEYLDTGKTVKESLKTFRRPRVHPLLTTFDSADGPRDVITTFSTTQIDLNYRDPAVLLDMVSTMMKNMQHGVDIFRMDAVTYMWKELGTESVNRPEAHEIIRLFRDIVEEVNPNAKIITETNVPHSENISYYGDGEDEAHMVYNFALPPLVLNAFQSGDATHLNELVAKMDTPSADKNAFLNFLGSHDGIGVMGAKEILTEEEIAELAQQVVDNGGKISYRSLPDGSESMYEMNATWWSALNAPDEDFDLAMRKFKTSIAINLALKGVPAIYIHTLLGSQNFHDPDNPNSPNRSINEQVLDYETLHDTLQEPNAKTSTVLHAVKGLMNERAQHTAFDPEAPQEVIQVDPRIFAIRRGDHGKENIVAFHNVSGEGVTFTYKGTEYRMKPYDFHWQEMEADPEEIYSAV
jgi:glycosidase